MAHLTDGLRDTGVSIALIGPQQAVRLLQGVAKSFLDERPHLQARFVGAPITGSADPGEHFRQLGDRIDGAVFAGQLQYDRAGGDAGAIPATYVAATQASLYAALLRASATPPPGRAGIDLSCVSIDSLTRDQVDDAYAELGVSSERVRVAAYLGPASVEDFTAFHLAAQREGGATISFTTRSSVTRDLRQAGLRVQTIQPTRETIRDALERGIALASGARLGEQQIAHIFVQLLTDGEKGSGASPAYWEQEAALLLHRILLDEVRRVGGVVSRRSDVVFAVTATRGALDELTDRLRIAPFLGAIRDGLGLPVAVGIGTGATAIAAELNAESALAGSIAAKGARALHVDDGEAPLGLVAGDGPSRPASEASRERLILDQLIDFFGSSDVELDVDDVSRALSVTTRTAHRILNTLVEAGLAWPLPTRGAAGGGRPKKRYRLHEARSLRTAGS